MQITIDTQKDSSSDIKKAIQLLQSLISESTQSMPISSQESTALFDMFGNSDSANKQSSQEPVQVTSILLDEDDKPITNSKPSKSLDDEDDSGGPQLIPY